jgi:hypothetical protein
MVTTTRLLMLVATALLFSFTSQIWGADPPAKKPEPGGVEVRFQDGSILKLVMREDKIDLQTPYGKLQIPVGEIARIEFGLRLSAETEQKIQAAIDNLTSPNAKEQDKAVTELLALREKALPALIKASKSVNQEPAKRAKEVLDRLRENLPEELLSIATVDTIHTEDSKFTGHVLNSELRVATAQFGDKQLKVVDIQSLRSLTLTEADTEPAGGVQGDPGNLINFAQMVGKTLYFRVTGTVQGSLWGTGTYTLDSTLGMAAVHMGLVQPGKTAVVKVTLMPSLPAYQGSTRNGVTSAPYAIYPAGCFKLHGK